MTASNLTEQRCGFVSVVGLSNVGKSTLMNEMVGQKVSIVSQKVQTTRNRILGITIHENAQIILIDTPGIFKPKKTLEKVMVSTALQSIDDADIILHIVDIKMKNPVEQNKLLFQTLKNHTHVVLVLNKVDKVSKPELLDISLRLNQSFPYEATFMISALSGSGVKDILHYLSKNVPSGMWMYPEDQITDMPMRLIAAEITRERIFHLIHQEIPYAVYVETEAWENLADGSIKISQVVYVEKESQKGILLGKGGQKIKAIGQSAREELQEMLEQKVHLKIFVKVQENWAERAENYQAFGLDLPK
ncbi:MAG: GTPase Era [Alphaproteobacteria bacterium]|nr:GTPase Era [Alphaproteobacteria bacterium]